MNKLEELDALVKAATPGPWSARIGGNYADDVWVASDAERPWEGHMALKLWSRTMGCGDYAIGSPEHKAACANAALIVWLVNNAPAMLRAQAGDNARLREALETIRDRHIPDQPMADDSDEATYARKHHTQLRNIARAALGSPPDA